MQNLKFAHKTRLAGGKLAASCSSIGPVFRGLQQACVKSFIQQLPMFLLCRMQLPGPVHPTGLGWVNTLGGRLARRCWKCRSDSGVSPFPLMLWAPG